MIISFNQEHFHCLHNRTLPHINFPAPHTLN